VIRSTQLRDSNHLSLLQVPFSQKIAA